MPYSEDPPLTFAERMELERETQRVDAITAWDGDDERPTLAELRRAAVESDDESGAA